MIKHILYKTTNLINNKIYIGIHSTENINDGYLGSGKALKRAIKKYDKENFERIILYDCKTYDEILKLESKIVDEYFITRKDTYNIALGGWGGIKGIKNPMFGKHCSKETKQKMSQSAKQRKYHPMQDKHHSTQTKQKMSQSAKNRIPTSEHTKQRMSEAQTGKNNGMYGKQHSDETKIKMSECKKDLNEITRKKMSESAKHRQYNIVKCPYCNKQGKGPNMTRYHFDNCKLKS